ncbi:MAG: adenylosuccinate synthetase [Bacteroidia bacterium]|nr:MAG: adenylosuccinate synthetase [Bacteroidia bacterium]
MQNVDVLLGLQWGDEGKGKLVDILSPSYDIIARFQGGPNAGHTLIFNGKKHVLHTIPSGIFREEIINLIGNGVVIDPVILMHEIQKIEAEGIEVKNRLILSKRAHLITPSHRWLDAASEAIKGKNKIGSTLKGIGPTYMDKTGRNGLRIGDIEQNNFKEKFDQLYQKHLQLLKFYNWTEIKEEQIQEWFKSIEFLKQLQIVDGEHYINDALSKGKKVLAEGAQGTLLDIDFGTYPFVTSSNTITAGACTGLGIAPNKIGSVYGIFKAYCTRVGSGPFPTELKDELGDSIRNVGKEFGSTTGRPRRVGWLDLPALKYAIQLDGVSELVMMKADVLSQLETIKVCTHYHYNNHVIDYLPYDISADNVTPIYQDLKGWQKDISECKSKRQLPKALLKYIDFIQENVGVKISYLSVGPDREQIVKL